jgi:hypothetical protein
MSWYASPEFLFLPSELSVAIVVAQIEANLLTCDTLGKIKVKACGVCGTDLHIHEGEFLAKVI